MGQYKIIKAMSATFRIDNSEDAGRSYGITANVEVDEHSVRSISNGTVSALETGSALADFSDYGNLNSNIYSSGAEADRMGIFAAISDFCDAVRVDRPALTAGTVNN